jgi:2-aminobenzoate-CoA ligase
MRWGHHLLHRAHVLPADGAVCPQHGVPTLRICVSAGEGLPDATRQLWKDATGIEMLDGIGATEMFHIFISSAGSEVRRGAIGKVVPGYTAKVVDDDGNEVPRGTVGKLAVIGPTGCRYLDDARQANYVKDGWNYPGDAFMQDADGYFFYQARADDMIITAGYNVGGPKWRMRCCATRPWPNAVWSASPMRSAA